MNLPRIYSLEEDAIDIVVSVINAAREKLGERQTLKQLANSRQLLACRTQVVLTSLKCPVAKTGAMLIHSQIKTKWKLTKMFLYMLKYMGTSVDECAQYYYFEAIFSQPTKAYPIPQYTASVFFRVQDKHVEPPELKALPKMIFRIEGHRQDHDVRYVSLTADRLLAVMMMKRILFQRIEKLALF